MPSDVDLQFIKKLEFQLQDKKRLIDFPELAMLGDLVEINPWHDHQDVLMHTRKVLHSLLQIPKLLAATTAQILDKYLSVKIVDHSRWQLIALAIFFHDIGKTATFVVNSDGTTICDDHERKSQQLAAKYLDIFLDNPAEKKYVLLLIEQHGLIQMVINEFQNGYSKENENLKEWQKNWAPITKKAPNLEMELLIHGWADQLGSDLKSLDSRVFSLRQYWIKYLLKKYLVKVATSQS